MANEENLRPGEYKLTVEEQKKGGIASGEARRRKKELRECFEILLSKEMSKDSDGNPMTGAEVLAAKMFLKASKGDVKAFEVVRDTAGQKPVERIETTQDVVVDWGAVQDDNN